MTTTRTQWPAAGHLQQAADQLRAPDPHLMDWQQDYHAPVADWLDKAANEMACWAPFHDHEGGYRPWRNATRIAHAVLGLPDPDTCPTCHTHARPEPRTTS